MKMQNHNGARMLLGVLVISLAALTLSFLQTDVTYAQIAAPALTADDTKANRVELSWDAVDGAARYEL